MLPLILLATFTSGILSLIGAFLLSRKAKWEESFSLQLTALASGVMLTTSLLHLIPEALHDATSNTVMMAVFIGVVAFFVLERMVWWWHHHHEHAGPKPSAWLITIGDSLHNFVDGVAIAAAFLVDPRLGIVTTLAVALHEIPQEIADFVTLVNSGVSRQKALLINIASAAVALLGAVLTVFVEHSIEPWLPLIVAFSAGMFLYIALSDLIPELHQHDHGDGKSDHGRWAQLAFFFLGIAVILITTRIAEPFLHAEESHDESVFGDEHIEEDIGASHQ